MTGRISNLKNRLSCGENIMRTCLFVFNVLFVLTGLALLIVGILACVNLSEIGSALEGWVKGPPIVIAVTGGFTFVIAFLGCFGAIKKSYCLLMTFAALLFCVCMTQLIVGIYVACNYDVGVSYVTNQVYVLFQTNQAEFHEMESALECCGVIDYSDYALQQLPIPASCCSQSGCQTNPLPTNIWRTGCQKAVLDMITSQGAIIGGVTLGLIIFEIAEIIFAILVARGLKGGHNYTPGKGRPPTATH